MIFKTQSNKNHNNNKQQVWSKFWDPKLNSWPAHQQEWGNIQINSLVQDCCNSIANALELLQSCTKPSIFFSWRSKSVTLQISNDLQRAVIQLWIKVGDSALKRGWILLLKTGRFVSLMFHKLSKIFLPNLCIAKIVLFFENFKLKLCMCGQSHAFDTQTIL